MKKILDKIEGALEFLNEYDKIVKAALFILFGTSFFGFNLDSIRSGLGFSTSGEIRIMDQVQQELNKRDKSINESIGSLSEGLGKANSKLSEFDQQYRDFRESTTEQFRIIDIDNRSIKESIDGLGGSQGEIRDGLQRIGEELGKTTESMEEYLILD